MAQALSRLMLSAGLCLRWWDDRPAEARRELEVVRQVAALALDEVQRILAGLGPAGPDPAGLERGGLAAGGTAVHPTPAASVASAARPGYAPGAWYPPGVGAPGRRLTPRERELVALVAAGEPPTAIARRLFLSEKTVRNHLARAQSKLGLADRTQLALWALRCGLVAPAEDGGPRTRRPGPAQ